MDNRLSSAWPSLPVAEWAPTRDTFQLWTQIAGKVRLANTPLVNHWWNVTLYVNSRGLTTSLIPHPSGTCFEIQFDLIDHELKIETDKNDHKSLPLRSQPVAETYAELMASLNDLGVGTKIWPMPVEIEGAIEFTADRVHATYDPDLAHQFWQVLVQVQRVLLIFRSRFVGKCSPIHLFWGALDLAVTRFSGRPAPPHPGGAPNCGPQVMLEAYSHEVSSCGYWPGGEAEGIFYSYAYPEPPGYREVTVSPGEALFNETLGEFVLGYETVRTAADPEAVLLAFLQSTYEAAADCAKWDRRALERQTAGM